MGINAQFPISNLTGPLTIPSTAVPVGAKQVALSLDYTTMSDPAINLDLVLEFAPDGVTWGPFTSVQGVRGGRLDRHGQPITLLPLLTVDIPAGSNRRVRGVLSSNGAALTTVAFVSTTP